MGVFLFLKKALAFYLEKKSFFLYLKGEAAEREGEIQKYFTSLFPKWPQPKMGQVKARNLGFHLDLPHVFRNPIIAIICYLSALLAENWIGRGSF